MDSKDFEFKEFRISEAVGLAFHGFDFVVGSFQRPVNASKQPLAT